MALTLRVITSLSANSLSCFPFPCCPISRIGTLTRTFAGELPLMLSLPKMGRLKDRQVEEYFRFHYSGVTPEVYDLNTKYWQEQVSQYWKLISANKMDIRNVMDMNAYYGGFSVALSTLPVWVMNIVPTTMINTLSAIYDRGLVGAFHDWCEPFSTYPRTYDLLHAFHLFSQYKNKEESCSLEDIMLEMDRIIRPQGFIIIRDEESIVSRINDIAPKFLWDVIPAKLENEKKEMEPVLICRKKFWAIV